MSSALAQSALTLDDTEAPPLVSAAGVQSILTPLREKSIYWPQAIAVALYAALLALAMLNKLHPAPPPPEEAIELVMLPPPAPVAEAPPPPVELPRRPLSKSRRPQPPKSRRRRQLLRSLSRRCSQSPNQNHSRSHNRSRRSPSTSRSRSPVLHRPRRSAPPPRRRRPTPCRQATSIRSQAASPAPRRAIRSRGQAASAIALSSRHRDR